MELCMEKGLEGNTQNVTMFIFFFSLLDCFTKNKYDFQDKEKRASRYD